MTTAWLRTRDLFVELVVRDIKLRYRGSLLGVLWTLINPLAELLVLLFVFGRVLRVDIPNFPSYLFIGLIVYTWFQTSLTFATTAFVANRELIRRPGVPAAVLPVVAVASNLVHFLLSLPILAGLFVMRGTPIPLTSLWLPVLVGLEFAFIVACAYPLAILYVWFRDMQHLLRVALQLLFYLTPVFYQVSVIPGPLRVFYAANPMARLMDAFRDVLMYATPPDPAGLAIVAAWSAVLLLAGLFWFRRVGHRFADEL